MQIDSLQSEIDETEQFSRSFFEEISIESETIDAGEMYNTKLRTIQEPTYSEVINKITEEKSPDDTNTIIYRPESNQVTNSKQQRLNEYVPMGDFTDIELDTGLFYLLEPLVDDPEFRESAKEILTTVKYVKEALFVDDELANDYGELIFRDNLENSTYKRNRINSQNKSTNGQYSPKKGTYDSSVIKEFIDKFKVFAIFLVVVIILIKLVFILISSREKANRA
jgi:hypothetical protein